MVPFVMRDSGEVRRQELLATSAHLELVKHLPAGGTERSAAIAWRRIAGAIYAVVLGQGSNRRYPQAVIWAGVRR